MARTAVMTGGSNSFQTTAEDINKLRTNMFTDGPIGTLTNTSGVAPMTGAWAVNAQGSPNMTVAVTGGDGHVTATPTSQASQRFNVNITTQNATIPSNSSGSTVYNYIYVALSATLLANPDVNGSTVASVVVTTSTSSTSDNSGAVPSFGNLVALVTNANLATSITNGNITDKRSAAVIATTAIPSSSSTTGWNALGFPLSYSANNGGKEFTVTTPNNLTSILSPGQRFQVTRAVTPPTQCFSFTAASSQSAAKSSPSGITFTGNFSCEAWVKLASYDASNLLAIISRDSAGGTASGWEFGLSQGRLSFYWRNGSGSSQFTSDASIPLNTWVHVAAVATAATPAAAFYLNGGLITSTTQASAATSVVQASTNLTMGLRNASAHYFDGKISEVRVWSATRTQQNIQDNMGVNLVGNESGLIALYSDASGTFADSTSNANTLTQSNGASATATDNPYNAIEYANVIAVSYSNPTTTLTLKTGPYGTIPNMTLNSPSYSTSFMPQGFPQALRQVIHAYSQITVDWTNTTVGSLVDISGLSVTLTIPTGVPRIKIRGFALRAVTTAAGNDVELAIMEGSAQYSEADQSVGSTTNVQLLVEAVIYPTPGSHTYKLQLAQSSSAGTMRFGANTGSPAFIEVVED